MLSSHAPRPLHIAGTGWCPTNAGDPTPSIAPGHARLAAAVAGSHSFASLKKLARASGAHVSPASCSPAAFAPWHVPLLRHHPHPGRFAHVAHDTAEWHSSRHSPTVSSDASFAKSGHPSSAASRERHRPDAGHHPHCARPRRTTRTSRARRSGRRTSSRTPANQSPPCPSEPPSKPPRPSRCGNSPPPPRLRPRRTRSAARRTPPSRGASRSRRPPAARTSTTSAAPRGRPWDRTRSSRRPCRTPRAHAPTSSLTVAPLGWRSRAGVASAFGRLAPSASARPESATPTRPPAGAPTAPLTMSRYASPAASRATTTRDRRAAPKPETEPTASGIVQKFAAGALRRARARRGVVRPPRRGDRVELGERGRAQAQARFCRRVGGRGVRERELLDRAERRAHGGGAVRSLPRDAKARVADGSGVHEKRGGLESGGRGGGGGESGKKEWGGRGVRRGEGRAPRGGGGGARDGGVSRPNHDESKWRRNRTRHPRAEPTRGRTVPAASAASAISAAVHPRRAGARGRRDPRRRAGDPSLRSRGVPKPSRRRSLRSRRPGAPSSSSASSPSRPRPRSAASVPSDGYGVGGGSGRAKARPRRVRQSRGSDPCHRRCARGGAGRRSSSTHVRLDRTRPRATDQANG